jgi:TorA maturation chaperone TorD
MPAAPTEEQARRAALYQLLAGLLRDAPGEAVLDYTRGLEADAGGRQSELPLALSTLALAARHSAVDSVRDEYHMLFIGLGRGELVPYGSWYQTGFLMEKPLGLLRADLRRLGFERDDDVREPEDHIAALCEVMSLMILDGIPIENQQQFFDHHLGNWAGDFFRDLAGAESAVFYRSVARLGEAFLSLETRYLSLLD